MVWAGARAVIVGWGVLVVLLALSALIGQWMGGPVVAFSADYDLWMVDGYSGIVRRLTFDGSSAEDDQPAWSPDGAQLAYMTVRRQPFNARLPNSDISVLSLRSGIKRLLRFTPAWEDSPAWSPDGRWIAFSEKGTGGGTTVRVVPFDARPDAEARLLYAHPLRNDVVPAWSTDSAWVYVHGVLTTGGTGVLRVDADSGLAEVVLPRTGYRPRPSPDGQWVALWMPALDGYTLSVWGAGMAFPRPLTESLPNPLPFAWMPDSGLTMVRRDGTVVRIDLHSGQAVPLFRLSGRVYALAWRP
jgi:hypothetical protein